MGFQYDFASFNGPINVLVQQGFVSAPLITPTTNWLVDYPVAGTYYFHSVNAGSGDVVLTAVAGDLSIGSISATSGTATLTASGSILDGDNDSAADVTAVNILMAAQGTIGTDSNDLDINSLATGSGQVTATAGQNINMEEKSGDLRVGAIVSTGGNVTLNAQGSIIDVDSDSAANVIGSHVTLIANSGTIGTVGNAFDINSGASSLTANASGDIYVIETTGNLNVHAVTSTGGNVTLETLNGSIRDADNTAASNINGDIITLVASGGIGTSGNDLDVDSSTLLTAYATGGIYLAELNNGLVLQNVNQIRSTTGNIRVTVTDLAGSGDDLVVRGADAAKADQGSVTFRAGDNFTIEALVVDHDNDLETEPIVTEGMITGTTISVYGDYGDQDAEGSQIDIHGHLVGNSVQIYSAGDADEIRITNVAPSSPMTVNAGGGADTINVFSDTLTVADIQANMTVNGQSGSDTLNINNSGDNSGPTGTLTNNTLSGLGMGGTINYGVETLNITLGAGDDMFTIAST
jgi:hypothetical protein